MESIKNKIYEKLGNFKKVESIGNNQFIIHFINGAIFQSYESIITIEFNGNDNKYYLGNNWNYSKTTSKYRNRVLLSNTKEIKQDIKNKVAILVEDL